MDAIAEWFAQTFGLGQDVQRNFLITVIAILAVVALRLAVLWIMRRRASGPEALYQWRHTLTYLAFAIGVLLILRIWSDRVEHMLTFLGLLSAGMAVALSDVLLNFTGWLFITSRRPFKIGDRVQIGDFAGDVVDVRAFQFVLMEIGNWVDADQSTGRLVHVPNGRVFREPLVNYTKSFSYIWNEVQVVVTFESNWEKAKEILHRVATRHSEHFMEQAEERLQHASRSLYIAAASVKPAVYTSVKDHGVQLAVRYICPARQRRDTLQVIWEDILREFARCEDIDFAYPTQRFYNNALEGKPRTRPSAVYGGD